MIRANILTVIEEGKEPTSYGSLKKVCTAYSLPINKLYKMKFPIEINGFKIHKGPLN